MKKKYNSPVVLLNYYDMDNTGDVLARSGQSQDPIIIDPDWSGFY